MLEAREFVRCADEFGYRWYAGVPCSFLTPFIDYVLADDGLSYVSASNEGDAVAAAAGAFLGGQRGVAMMQNSGLGNAVNPLASLTYIFRFPVLLIITWRGEPDLRDEPQHQLMGRITASLLETLEIPWTYFPTESGEVRPVLEQVEGHLQIEQRPYALIMRRGSVVPHGSTSSTGADAPEPTVPRWSYWSASPGQRPSRTEALQQIIECTPLADTVIVATTGYTGRELLALADRPNQLYMVGSMGCASSFGLGLAMVRPDLRVVVIDGDGAALMRMGNLPILGAYGQSNLIHLLLDNGVHDSTGAQRTVSGGMSFAGVAQACGYGCVLEGDDLDMVNRALERRDRIEGPLFAHLRIRPGAPEGLPRPQLTPPQVRQRLMDYIGPPPQGTQANPDHLASTGRLT